MARELPETIINRGILIFKINVPLSPAKYYNHKSLFLSLPLFVYNYAFVISSVTSDNSLHWNDNSIKCKWEIEPLLSCMAYMYMLAGGSQGNDIGPLS